MKNAEWWPCKEYLNSTQESALILAFLNLFKLTFSRLNTKSILKRLPVLILCYGTRICTIDVFKEGDSEFQNIVIYGKGSHPHLPLPRN